MPVATSPVVSSHPSGLVKMEDRKRPALSATDEIAPPSKRQAINGGSKSRDDNDLRDEAWIEDYQKDAIYRQMLEYRREKTTLESRLEEVTKRSTHHDDHLRVVDQWWLQLLEEVELAAQGSISSDLESKEFSALQRTALQFKDHDEFREHLRDKSRAIKARLETLFSLISAGREVKPDVAELEAQVTKSRATIKDLLVKLDRSNAEKDTLSEQLDTATLRYVKAEKKLDRAKSAQVQKLEQQALKNATARAPSAERGADEAGTNGNSEALQLKHDEAVAVLSKQKEQLAAALAEIKALQEQNTSLKARQETVTDEDYSRTDLFKYFKSQNEDLIRRINSLEVINKQLREEAEKLQSERTAFREQLSREAQAVSAELEEQLHQKDQDLTRIRSIRDDLNANLTIQKAKADQERTSSEHIKDLLSAKDDRITGLELELERLRPTEDAAMSTPREDLEALPPADLITRYIKLEKDFELIKSEVPSVEKAYKKAVALSQKKLTDMAALESKVVSLAAEKNKAEQKYFAARRDTDARINENKTLQMQNKTSSTIISQLKDVEAHTRTLVTNLEKQLTEMKQSNIAILEDNRKIKAASSDAMRLHEALKSQASNLNSLVKAKDSAAHSFKEKVTSCEQELEKVKVRLEHALKERDNYKSRGSSDSEENLRKFALCNVCNGNFKNVTLKTCGHVFCNECVESRVANRRRKCPSCGKAFDKMDVMHIHM
ncbi:E3 ubiquitin-protein ligase bre-1 [Magnaporthiopsis poae ATCC 64411]|uniref:E3 ubiquitin protein ligase n=2 Tax=Magnaporthiopsis poae (strain ATCC 64411 / 73-15) TaxID=644358 RepID=A0A0C4E1R8_MAGP6|nr:E3 ubiquitin-protein ligase bre-1 [Magnaporthiopsis poae ATCC 64411]